MCCTWSPTRCASYRAPRPGPAAGRLERRGLARPRRRRLARAPRDPRWRLPADRRRARRAHLHALGFHGYNPADHEHRTSSCARGVVVDPVGLVREGRLRPSGGRIRGRAAHIAVVDPTRRKHEALHRTRDGDRCASARAGARAACARSSRTTWCSRSARSGHATSTSSSAGLELDRRRCWKAGGRRRGAAPSRVRTRRTGATAAGCRDRRRPRQPHADDPVAPGLPVNTCPPQREQNDFERPSGGCQE